MEEISDQGLLHLSQIAEFRYAEETRHSTEFNSSDDDFLVEASQVSQSQNTTSDEELVRVGG